MNTAVQLVEALVERFPVLRPLYEEHVSDNGEVLPYVIFGIGNGITDRVVDAYLRDGSDELDWRAVLRFLDAQIGRGDRDVDDVIGTDFLWGLPGPTRPGYGIVEELPENLRKMFDGVRPHG